MAVSANDPRPSLLALLERYKPLDERDRIQALRIADFVRAHEKCFERTHLIGHLTGSAWLVNSAGTHVLLTRHKKLNKWLQLGGHADGNSDLLAVAIRESKEESGLDRIDALTREIFDVDVHLIPERGLEPEHFHYDIRFALKSEGSDFFKESEESHNLAWVPLERIEDYSTEESIRRMVRKWNNLYSN